MFLKRVVVMIGMVLLMIGIVNTASAEIAFRVESGKNDPVVCEAQNPQDTTTQNPIALEGEPRSMDMLKVNDTNNSVAALNADEESEAIEKIEMPAETHKESEEVKKQEGIISEELRVAEKEKAEVAEREAKKSETPKQEPVEELVEAPEEEQTAEPLKEGTIVDPNMDVSEIVLEEYVWESEVLNSYNGTVKGPNGKETYYNLDMTGVIWIMEDLGYNYKYSVREDGVKMYGPFIMVAADLDLRPRGSIIKTSLGWAMVCDTGAFTQWNPTQLDVAVTW